MTAPTTADNPIRPLLFYREERPGAGRLVWDERVRVDEVLTGTTARLSDAKCSIETAGLGTTMLPELTPDMIERIYGPMVRCAIGPAPQPLADDVILMQGYPVKRGLSFGVSPGGQAQWQWSLQIESVLARLADQREAFVQGRYMLSRRAWESYFTTGIPDPFDDYVIRPGDLPGDLRLRQDLVKQVEGPVCCFNAGGFPNRLRWAIELGSEIDPHPNGVVHLFTHDGDVDAEYWTAYQALRYLLMFHMPWHFGVPIACPDIFIGAGDPDPLGLRDLWSLPASPSSGAAASGFRGLVLRNCESLTLEGKNLIEALVYLCQEIGIQFHEEHTADLDGDAYLVGTNLRIWSPADKAPELLSAEAAAGHMDGTVLRPIADIVEYNNVSHAQLQIDHAKTVADVRVIGDRRYVTVTAELIPLWSMDHAARWDGQDGVVTQTDADNFRVDAYSKPFETLEGGTFFANHHAHGADFRTYAEVGRLWGIDCGGEFTGVDFRRSAGAWAGAHQAPFDFADLVVDPAYAGPALPDQVVRRRRMENVSVEKLAGQQDPGVLLEISWDAGDDWWQTNSEFQVIGGTTFLYLTPPDLLAFAKQTIKDNANELVDNVYDAYLKGVLRLRATFALELDERVVAAAYSASCPLAGHLPVQTILRDKDIKQIETARYLNEVEDFGYVPEEIDDTEKAARFASAMLGTRVQAVWRGAVIVPWHEWDRWPLGTPISGIRRHRTTGADLLFSRTGESAQLPHVVAKAYRQTNEVSTELILEDFALRPHLAP